MRTPTAHPRSKPGYATLLQALVGTLALGAVTTASAQSAAAPAGAEAAPEEDMVILSPFEVSSNSDVGYQTNETLAGGRFRTSYKDVSSQVNVMTQELIKDLAIGTVEESFRFSMNIERENDFYDVQRGSNKDSSNPTGNNTSRTRGLGKSTTTHDFFETYIAVDTYNTEKITFVSGPNAILFGNGQAGGSIETGYLRPDLNRMKTKVETRFETLTNGYRASIDHNQPIFKKILGVRVAALRADEDPRTRPSSNINERQYGALTLQPHKTVKIFGYMENVNMERQIARPILIQDKVTPYLNSLGASVRDEWLKTGNPALLKGFDNSTLNSTHSSANTSALAAAVLAQGFGVLKSGTINSNFSPVSTSSTAYNPVIVLDANGIYDRNLPVMTWGNTIRSEGPEQYASVAENVYDWTLNDNSIYPTSVNISGNSSLARTKGRIEGVIVEFSPLENLSFEYAFNQEKMEVPFVQWMPYGKAELHLDVNKYLPLAWTGSTVPARTLNPNFGRYYMDTAGGDSTFGTTINHKKDFRATALYRLDFTNKKGFLKHLGTHNLTAGYSGQFNRLIQATQGNEMRIVSNNVFTTETAGTQLLNNNNRRVSLRYYIDSPSADKKGNFVMNLPFDPWEGGTLGYDSAGTPVVVSTFDTGTPGQATAIRNTGSATKQSTSKVVAMQNSFLKGKLVTTFGLRQDRNEVTLWALPTRQPRWDALNNQWFYPTATTPLPSRLANAPYMEWHDLMEAPDYNRIDRTNIEPNPRSKLGGVVFHATNWLSLYYNSSSSKFATDFARKNLDGSTPQLEDGVGYDTGFMLNLIDNRLNFRLNFYKTSKTGTSSAFRDVANGAPGVRPIRDLMAYVERSYYQTTGKTADASFKYYPYIYDIDLAGNYSVPNYTGTGNPGSYGGARDDYDLLSDMVAKGIEATVTANITPNWRLSVTAAKNETTESNIGPQYFDFFKERVADYETIPNSTILASGVTMKDFMQKYLLPQLNFVNAVEGFPNNMARKYRVNVTTRYEFKDGIFKNIFVGSSMLYRSKAGIGYKYRLATPDDIKYDYLGVAANSNTYEVPDIESPLYNKYLLSLDAFLGYERKIFKNKIKWRIQANIQNLFKNQDFIPMRGQVIDGKVVNTVYANSEPRTVRITNSFEF